MRQVCFFTATRAEYGLLKPVMRLVEQSAAARLQLLVSGAHLERRFGHTLDEIVADGFQPDACLPLPGIGGNSLDIATATGSGITLYAQALQRLRPDILVVLGDRYETFAAATAAHICGLCLAHIHGGETTEGAIDEAFRHSITKMSHLHFTSCEAYRQRVIQLGEQPDRVFNVGSLGVENARRIVLLDEQSLREELELAADTPYMVCTMHPVTLDARTPEEQIGGLLAALDDFPEHSVIFTGANADPAGAAINAAIQAYVAKRPRHRFFMSLGQKRYFSAVAYAACVIGNSSSGIIEAPSFGVPVIDIGDRQKGRIRSALVGHSGPAGADILASLRKVLTEEHEREYSNSSNPYEKAGTSQAIVTRLASHPLDNILKKHFHNCACHGLEAPSA